MKSGMGFFKIQLFRLKKSFYKNFTEVVGATMCQPLRVSKISLDFVQPKQARDLCSVNKNLPQGIEALKFRI